MGVRRGIDIARIASAAKRPGVDPRINLSYAIVQDVAYDAEHGMFADVQLVPDTGQTFTIYVGSAYAGDNYGAWGAIRKDDFIVVGIPMGDPALGCFFVTKVWTATAKPPAEFEADSGNMDAAENPVVVVEPGKTLRVIAHKGASVSVEVSDGGSVNLLATGQATVNLKSENAIDIDAPDITVGGKAGIARVGDLVALTVPLPSPATPTTVVGQIASGSSRAKA